MDFHGSWFEVLSHRGTHTAIWNSQKSNFDITNSARGASTIVCRWIDLEVQEDRAEGGEG